MGIKQKEKIPQLDFVRVICAFGIILFHISCYSTPNAPKLFFLHANGNWGTPIVGTFLLISGGVLYHNYPEIDSLFGFYYKRWKSLFPMFYITFFYYFVQNVIAYGKIFYAGQPWTFIFTILGLDGYFLYRFYNYYIIGEWFLGAIILLYILYPLFVKLIYKLNYKILFISIPLLLWQFQTDIFLIENSHNIIYCSNIFIFGMLIFKYKLWNNKVIKIFSILTTVLLIYIPIPILGKTVNMFLSISLFFTLSLIGEIVLKNKIFSEIIQFIGKLSFPIFLVQNKWITKLVEQFNPITTKAIIKTQILAIIMCMISAWCVSTITKELLKTKWFLKFEQTITEKINNHRGIL